MVQMAHQGFLPDSTRVLSVTDLEVLVNALLANVVRVG